jgi:hypothetical protein
VISIERKDDERAFRGGAARDCNVVCAINLAIESFFFFFFSFSGDEIGVPDSGKSHDMEPTVIPMAMTSYVCPVWMMIFLLHLIGKACIRKVSKITAIWQFDKTTTRPAASFKCYSHDSANNH